MGSAITLQWEEATLAEVHAAVRAAYPEEACGFLLGRGEIVRRVLTVTNVAADPRRDYLVDPRALLAAHRRASEDDLDVIGVFHSHPDGPARLSARDLELAEPGWIYAVVATRGREPSDFLVRRL